MLAADFRRQGIGPGSAAALLITAGDNPDRMQSEASFAVEWVVGNYRRGSGGCSMAGLGMWPGDVVDRKSSCAVDSSLVAFAPPPSAVDATHRHERCSERAFMTPILAIAAASWAVLMGVAPLLQVRRMMQRRSSADVSIAYLIILMPGFGLWMAYGIASNDIVLVVPNAVALIVAAVAVGCAIRMRPRPRPRRTRGP